MGTKKIFWWFIIIFRDFIQEFEEQGLLYQKEHLLTTDLSPYDEDLTNLIQSFIIYTNAQSLNKQEQRILITIILLHSDHLGKFTTRERQCLIERWSRDLVPIISRLTQKLEETPITRASNSTCVLYDELFEYFDIPSTKVDDCNNEMEELD